jgi:hypothetical protein
MPSGLQSDTHQVRVVVPAICAFALALTTAADARPPTLLQTASARSGLRIRAQVRTVLEGNVQFTAGVRRAFDREYPPTLLATEDAIDDGLGLGAPERPLLLGSAEAERVWYDARARVLHVRRARAPTRAQRLEQLVLALVDQNYGLRRLVDLRAHDRDAALAADGVVAGLASLVARTRLRVTASSTALGRFLAAEESVGAGRAFVATLRNIGGTYAVKTALRKFPTTTEQLLHPDTFLEHERAQPIAAPSQIGETTLRASESFGELDLRALLSAFGVPNAAAAAAGWSGGRALLYARGSGAATVALALRWDSDADATDWVAAASDYVKAAFPNAKTEVCPAALACWIDGPRGLAIARSGSTTGFGSGADGELLAAILSTSS